jgi:hypothetical protein
MHFNIGSRIGRSFGACVSCCTFLIPNLIFVLPSTANSSKELVIFFIEALHSCKKQTPKSFSFV